MSTEPSAKMTPSRRAVLQAALAAALTAVAGPAQAATPFFKLYLMIPNNQPARMIWGTLAAQQMTRIGIDVVSELRALHRHRPAPRRRATARPHAMAAGTAISSATTTTSIKPSPNTLFRSTAMPPNGQNFYYVNDPEIDRRCATSPAARWTKPIALKAYQGLREALVRHPSR